MFGSCQFFKLRNQVVFNFKLCTYLSNYFTLKLTNMYLNLNKIINSESIGSCLLYFSLTCCFRSMFLRCANFKILSQYISVKFFAILFCLFVYIINDTHLLFQFCLLVKSSKVIWICNGSKSILLIDQFMNNSYYCILHACCMLHSMLIHLCVKSI